MTAETYLIFSGLWFDVHSQLDLYIGKLLDARKGMRPVVVLCNAYRLFDDLGNDCERFWVDGTKQPALESGEAAQSCRMCVSGAYQFWQRYGVEIVEGTDLMNRDAARNTAVAEIIRTARWDYRDTLIKQFLPCMEDWPSKDDENRIVSSVFTRTRTSSLQELQLFCAQNKCNINGLLDNALRLYLFGLHLSDMTYKVFPKTKLASTFSGRFNPSAGFLAYHKAWKRPLLVHERGSMKGSFSICLSGEPANPFVSYPTWYLERKRSLDNGCRRAVTQHVTNKMLGKNQNGYEFARLEVKNEERSRIDQYICYMTSSSDEISAFLPSCTYKQQLRDIKAMIGWGKKNSTVVVVRHHPNLGRVGRPNQAKIFLDCVKALETKNVLIIDPSEDVNTYRLAFGAAWTMCPQSTLSIDLPLLGCKVIAPNYSPYSPFYHKSISVDEIWDISPGEMHQIAVDNISHCRDIEYLGFKHYLSTSWTFEGITIEGFKPGTINLDQCKRDSGGDQLISHIDQAISTGYVGFLCWDVV